MIIFYQIESDICLFIETDSYKETKLFYYYQYRSEAQQFLIYTKYYSNKYYFNISPTKLTYSNDIQLFTPIFL